MAGAGYVTSVPWRDSFLYEYFKNYVQAPWILNYDGRGVSLIDRQATRASNPHPAILALRTRDWKYITYPGDKYGPELYNLANDPGEAKNLMDTRRSRRKGGNSPRNWIDSTAV